MDLDTVLPFAAPAGHHEGQQSLPFAADPSPLPPAAAVSLMGRPFVAEWSPDAAYRCFLLLLDRLSFDEDLAYDELIDAGCPLVEADAAWHRWSLAVVA